MLRNCLQVTFSGLVTISLSACTNVKPLLATEAKSTHLNKLYIKADPYVGYRFSNVFQRLVSTYLPANTQYEITIEIKEHESSAIYTQKEIAKEQIRMTAHIDVYDNFYNHIGSKMLDPYSTYEACDEMPHSVTTAKLHTRDVVIQELAQASALAIKAITAIEGTQSY